MKKTLRIAVVKKADVQKSGNSVCPWIIEGLPEPRK